MYGEGDEDDRLGGSPEQGGFYHRVGETRACDYPTGKSDYREDAADAPRARVFSVAINRGFDGADHDARAEPRHAAQ